MSRILITGIATVDLCNYVSHYPVENEEIRASRQIKTMGGNAANTAIVLSQLKHQVEFAGTLSADSEGQWIQSQLRQCHISSTYAKQVEGHSPVSYILVNEQNGSRTIVHHRDLPEFNFKNFYNIPVAEYDWLHFEARNTTELVRILKHTQQQRFDQPISLEIEKERENIDTLFAFADVLIFSQHFVQGRGYHSATEFLTESSIAKQHTSQILICPWGEDGAWARDQHATCFHRPAFKPDRVIDTLGAGDTFNAGLIHQLCSGHTVFEALEFACKIAGKKVGQFGLDDLG